MEEVELKGKKVYKLVDSEIIYTFEEEVWRLSWS